MEVTIVYSNKKDKEFLDLINLETPIFIKYVNSISDKKSAYQIKSYWGAKLDPFVVIQEEDKIIKVFYSEKEDAINQLINYLNGSINKEIRP